MATKIAERHAKTPFGRFIGPQNRTEEIIWRMRPRAVENRLPNVLLRWEASAFQAILRQTP